MVKTIRFNGCIGYYDITSESVQAALDEADGADVEVRLSSPGGDLFEALAIYDVIKEYKGKKTCILVGFVASAATFIVTAFDKVVASTTSMFMIHNASTVAFGKASEIRQVADDLDKINELLVGRLTDFSKKDKQDVRDAMDKETTYYGKEILENGFASKYIDTGEDAPEKDTAVALAKIQMKNFEKKIAAMAYRKTEEEKEETIPMDKKLEEQLKVAFENKEITLKEIAEISGASDVLITDEQKKVLDSVKDLDIEDLKKKAKEAEAIAFSNILDAEFGVKAEDNKLRQAVDDFVSAGIKDIDKIKTLPSIIDLAAKKAENVKIQVAINAKKKEEEGKDNTEKSEDGVQTY